MLSQEKGGMPVAREREGRAMRCARLFFSMLTISAFTFGGGFVIVTLMKRKFVDAYGWLDEQEMLDYTTIAQSCPGAIAVNAAILTGWRVAGLAGMLCAVAGTILPPLVLLSVISLGYSAFAGNRYVALALAGMQAGVAAVIVDVVLSMGGRIVKSRDAVHLAVLAASLVASYVFQVNVVLIIAVAALVALLRAALRLRKGAGA